MKYTIQRFNEVDSTNNVAGKLADEGAPEGTVVVADIQTQGRGRKGDHWVSPEGGLWFTIILRPEVTPQRSVVLPLLTGMAMYRTLRDCDVMTRIKLPNDIMLNGKKLCGILCENRIQGNTIRYILTGVGMNVYNTPPSMGISLADHITTNEEVPTRTSKSGFDLESILHIFLEHFRQEYSEFVISEYLLE